MDKRQKPEQKMDKRKEPEQKMDKRQEPEQKKSMTSKVKNLFLKIDPTKKHLSFLL